MFTHLVVPLDGSRLAEAALPAAAYLADKLGASVTLLHIIEHDAPQAIHGERHLTQSAEAEAYLNDVARRAFPPTVRVASHVHTAEMADVARGIADHAKELGLDLIVMCTHGSGGLGGWLYGSIAQQVVGQCSTPVLLIRPDESGMNSFVCRNMLVPLDGNAEHEGGLPVAADLARACGAALHLLLVVPTLGTLSGREAATGMLLPGATRAVLELAHQDAAAYLRERMAAIQGGSLAVSAEVQRGDPLGTIVERARTTDADLIVLGTHGKAGAGAFWSGSLSPKISSRSHRPLLLVPVALAGDRP